MEGLSQEQWERAQAAFYPFIDRFNLSLNPEDIDEIIYAIVTHMNSPASPEEVADTVRSRIAHYLDQHRRMYSAGVTHERTSNPEADGASGWVVWRQDDHGNRAEVSRYPQRAAAEARAAELEARGHKQTYWVAQAEA